MNYKLSSQVETDQNSLSWCTMMIDQEGKVVNDLSAGLTAKDYRNYKKGWSFTSKTCHMI